MSEQVKQGQGINHPKPPRKAKKGMVIGGICAAVLVLAVVMGVVIVQSLSRRWEKNILMEAGKSDIARNSVIGSDIPKMYIKTITFVDSLKDMPDDAWDVSADGSGRVMAWVEKNGDYDYDLYIGGKGGVAANEDSSKLFAYYPSVERIQFNGNFHTENAVNMSGMFLNCWSLKSVDVSDCDTSKVTDTDGMFQGCNNLTRLDLSNFTSRQINAMDIPEDVKVDQ